MKKLLLLSVFALPACDPVTLGMATSVGTQVVDECIIPDPKRLVRWDCDDDDGDGSGNVTVDTEVENSDPPMGTQVHETPHPGTPDRPTPDRPTTTSNPPSNPPSDPPSEPPSPEPPSDPPSDPPTAEPPGETGKTNRSGHQDGSNPSGKDHSGRNQQGHDNPGKGKDK